MKKYIFPSRMITLSEWALRSQLAILREGVEEFEDLDEIPAGVETHEWNVKVGVLIGDP